MLTTFVAFKKAPKVYTQKQFEFDLKVELIRVEISKAFADNQVKCKPE